MNVKIIADSTCDLNNAIIQQYDIDIIPLHVILGDNIYKDKVEMTPEKVIEWSNTSGKTPKTSAPSVEEYQEVFQPYVDAGRSIVCLTISSEMSATYQSATLAAKEYPDAEIHIVDTRNITMGAGLLVMQAARLAQEGRSAWEVVEEIMQLIPKVHSSFFIDTMTFLARGGRCSALAAFGANALKIKPQIIAKDGKMTPGEKFRGSTLRVCEKYCHTVLDDIHNIDPERVIIGYTPMDMTVLEKAYEAVKSKGYFKDIMVMEAGCVITSHGGPSALGIFYIEK